jgi:hypothetical protein
MPICFVALMGAPLFLSLGWTHARFGELAQLETGIIALDNASILLGRSARGVWQDLTDHAQQMRAMEVAHHVAHACARAPLPNPACVTADLAWEARLRHSHAQGGVLARTAWVAGTARAKHAAARLGFSVFLDRPGVPPIAPVYCPVCLLPVGWRGPGSWRESARVRVHARAFENAVTASSEGGLWRYQVREVENAR